MVFCLILKGIFLHTKPCFIFFQNFDLDFRYLLENLLPRNKFHRGFAANRVNTFFPRNNFRNYIDFPLRLQYYGLFCIDV